MASDHLILTEQIHIISNKYVHMKKKKSVQGEKQTQQVSKIFSLYKETPIRQLLLASPSPFKSGLEDVLLWLLLYTKTAWEASFHQ